MIAQALQDKIFALAAVHDMLSYRWSNGQAPSGYIKGMAVVYAEVYAAWKQGDVYSLDMAKADTRNEATDALAHYETRFLAGRMSNRTDGADTLRHLWVLLIGLGLRESSGKYYEGRDPGAGPETAEETEAGLFQMSQNIFTASPLLPKLFAYYWANPTAGYLELFKQGVGDHMSPNYGDGQPVEFQKLAKTCPAFAAKAAAIGLRHRRNHWGPINRHEAQVVVVCDNMLKAVQDLVESQNLTQPVKVPVAPVVEKPPQLPPAVKAKLAVPETTAVVVGGTGVLVAAGAWLGVHWGILVGVMVVAIAIAVLVLSKKK